MIFVFLVETTNKGKSTTTDIDSFCFYVYNNLTYPFNSVGKEFHQYQQNEQSPLT